MFRLAVAHAAPTNSSFHKLIGLTEGFLHSIVFNNVKGFTITTAVSVPCPTRNTPMFQNEFR